MLWPLEESKVKAKDAEGCNDNSTTDSSGGTSWPVQSFKEEQLWNSSVQKHTAVHSLTDENTTEGRLTNKTHSERCIISILYFCDIIQVSLF